jgi:predicted phosphate transport protein (TIGR00153 family)
MKREQTMFRVTKKEEAFYDMFLEATENTCKAAGLLNELMTDYVNTDEKIQKIEEAEHEGDRQIHKIMEQLNKSFITPIDREDIYEIAKMLDNITDAIESTAHRFKMFNVKSMHEDAVKMVKSIVTCTQELKGVMAELKNMKGSKTLQKKIIEVNRLEDEGDKIFRESITKLFSDEKDGIEVVKWKEIYEFLENTLDACEDVANIIEGVVMKHA